MVLRPQDRERGLSAFNEARQVRRRAIVFGRVRIREVATRFWILTFVGLAVFAVVYYRYSEAQLAAQRHDVKSRQRAVAAAIGSGALELRDKLEGWVQELAGESIVPRVAAGVSLDAVSREPGIYFRLLLADARDPIAIRIAATRSRRDGFTSCLFVGRSGDPKQGTTCKETSQCGPGELCNDFRVCAPPSPPYNARLLYEATRLLVPEWDAALEAAPNDMQVRAIELDLEDTAKHEVPAAVTLVRTSKYFTLLLDEPASEEDAPQELDETAAERVQAVDHFVRVGLWDIERGERLLSLRLEAAGRYVAVGQNRKETIDVERAQRRQANNCALATRVRAVLASGSVAPPAEDFGNSEAPDDLVADE
jgi:hypothetical protein